MNEDAKLIKIGRLDKSGKRHDGNIVYGTEGISPTIMARDYKGPVKVLVKTNKDDETSTEDMGGVPIINATSKGYLLAYDGDGIDLSYPNSKTRRGRVQPQMAHTLQTGSHLGVILFE